ncbi:MAG: protein phosphatase 2C domain-containing protein [Gemmatimonadales bacterium]|jgi:protein phosphatase|nr:protein phosphatase 2C domain-containing protein [Gemmatimonadales bacterium]
MASPDLRPSPEHYDIFGLSHPGLKREENQDHFLIASLHKAMRVYGTSLPREYLPADLSRPRGVLALVADGVGGGVGGREASSTTLSTIARYLTDATDLYVQLDPSAEAAFVSQLRQSVEASHAKVVEASGRDVGRRGMATTLTMVMVVWPRAFVVHVGDSRAYRLRGGQLELVTHDQTMAQAMVDAGAITPEQAEASHLKHVLWSAVGGREAAPEVRVLDCEWSDMMLLCTDGITKHVSDDEIRSHMLTLPSSEAVCRALTNLALERGGSDNITVIAGRLRPPATA